MTSQMKYNPAHIKGKVDARKELNYIEGEFTFHNHNYKVTKVIFPHRDK